MNMLFGPVKVGVELAFGDREGASRTWSDFTRTNPLVVPVRLLYDLADDNPGEAMKTTCKTFGGALDNMVNSTPGVGHVKGGLTCIVNKDKGLEILNQATRTTAVAGAGIGGFVIGGPVGAAAAATVTGVGYDSVATVATRRGRGIVFNVSEALRDEPLSPGEWFDTLTSPVVDGATGLAAGKTYSNVRKLTQKEEIKKSKTKRIKPGKFISAVLKFEECREVISKLQQKYPKLSNAINHAVQVCANKMEYLNTTRVVSFVVEIYDGVVQAVKEYQVSGVDGEYSVGEEIATGIKANWIPKEPVPVTVGDTALVAGILLLTFDRNNRIANDDNNENNELQIEQLPTLFQHHQPLPLNNHLQHS